MAERWSLGLDVGSSATKGVLLDGREVRARAIRRSRADFAVAARACRDKVADALRQLNNVSFENPQGAFYSFFRIDGLTDSLDATLRIIDEANVGLAPGGTFGPGGEGFLRMCYLRDPDSLDEALDRLTAWLQQA